MKLMRSTTLATMALTLLSALPLAGPVSAQSVSHTASTVSTKTWSVQGALTIGKVAVIFPVGSTFTASYNSNDGSLTNGSLSVPERTITWPGWGVDIKVKLKDLGDATGWLAPNGYATITDSLTATINNTMIDAPCDVGPMEITVSTASAGGSVFQGAPSTGTLVDSEFTAPRPTVAGQCDQEWADTYTHLPLPSKGNVKVTLTEVVNPVSSWSTKTWAVQGTLAIGKIALNFPVGSRFTADYDANSGTLANGSLSVPESSLYWGGGISISVKLKDLGDATGTLAPNGVATISDSLTATINNTLIDAPCDVGPMAITVGTLAAGGSAFHGTPSTGTLVDPQFTAPRPTVAGQCDENWANEYSRLPLPSEGSVTVTLIEILPPPPAIYDLVQPAVFLPGVVNDIPMHAFGSVSCSSPGNCTAAGGVYSAEGSFVPMTQTSTNGVWAPSVLANVTGISSDSGSGFFNSISCSAPGYCTAAGYYNLLAITSTSTNGVWAPAVEAVFSSDTVRNSFGPTDEFSSISCSSPGNCTAVGQFQSDKNIYPMTATSTNGVWGLVTAVDFPQWRDDPINTAYSQVSCSSAGNCTATGYYEGSTESLSFTSTSTNGVWGGVEVLYNTKITSLSCTAPGYCTAAGSLQFDSREAAMTMTQTDGVWAEREMVYIDPAVQPTAINRSSYLKAISCTAPGDCTAVGTYVDPNNKNQFLGTTSTRGLWSPVALSPSRDSLGNPIGESFFSAVSCTSPGNCMAGGRVENGSQGDAATITQAGGVWGPVVRARFGSNVTPTPSTFGAISCGGPNSCTAAGTYYPGGMTVGAMTMSTRSAGPPTAPVNTTAQAAPGHAIVSWRPPTNTYGSPITEYRVTVLRGNAKTVVKTITVPASATQTVPALPVGSYSFSVAAVTSNGVGASAATSNISVTSTKGVRVPPAPRIMPSKVADGQVTLSWLPPVLSDGGSPIYQYVATDGQGHGCVVGTDARIAVNTFTCNVTGLTNGRVYGFTVQAVNIMGSSVASSVKYMRPASAPKTAPILSINSITAKRVTFDIVAPANMGGSALLYYRVSYNNGRTWTSLANFTSGDQVYLGLLKPNTTYRILISARNAIGAGPAASVTFKTARK